MCFLEIVNSVAKIKFLKTNEDCRGIFTTDFYLRRDELNSTFVRLQKLLTVQSYKYELDCDST